MFPTVNAGKDIPVFLMIIVVLWERWRTSFHLRAGPVISAKTGSSSACSVWDFICAFLASLPSLAGKNSRQHIHLMVWMGPSGYTEWISSSEGWHDHAPWRCFWEAGVSVLQSNGQRKRWEFPDINSAQKCHLDKLQLFCSLWLLLEVAQRQGLSVRNDCQVNCKVQRGEIAFGE